LGTQPDTSPAPRSEIDLSAASQRWIETVVVPLIVEQLSTALLSSSRPIGAVAQPPKDSPQGPQAPSVKELLLTKQEAAKMLPVSVRTIENQICFTWQQALVRDLLLQTNQSDPHHDHEPVHDKNPSASDDDPIDQAGKRR
jgi:hypothetical protein